MIRHNRTSALGFAALDSRLCRACLCFSVWTKGHQDQQPAIPLQPGRGAVDGRRWETAPGTGIVLAFNLESYQLYGKTVGSSVDHVK